MTAAEAHERGWYVFPVGGETFKKPLVKWRKYTATPEALARWSKSPRVTGYGIDCGRSGLVVLDEDRAGALEAMCGRLGEELPPTYSVSTAKGRHLYFLAPEDVTIRNSASTVLGDGVDVRADGGYVVGSGSMHACGWIYATTTDHCPAPLPSWLADLLGESVSTSEPRGSADAVYCERTSAWGRAVLDDAVARVSAARVGTRNQTLRDQALHISSHVKGGHIERNDAVDALRDAASCAGLGSEEIDATLAGAARDARPLPTLEEMFPDLTAAEIARAEGGNPTAGGSGNRRNRGSGVSIGGSEPLYADLRALVAGGLPVPRADAGPPRSDGERWLYYGRLNGLFGDSESAKTLVALGVIAHELIGGGHGAFLDTDHNGPQHIARTLLRFAVSLDDLDRFRYVEPESREEIGAVVADLCANMPRGMVVLDSFGENIGLLGGAGASANVDEFVLRTHRMTSKPLADAGHCVVVIDHNAKNTASRGYGATGSNAKKRIVDGAYLEVKIVEEFDPARGGQSALMLKKDRTGGIRALGYKTDEQVVRFRIGSLSGADANGNGGSQSVEFPLPDLTAIPAERSPRAATEDALATAGVQPTDSVREAERKVVASVGKTDRKALGITRDLVRDVFKDQRRRSAVVFPETDEAQIS